MNINTRTYGWLVGVNTSLLILGIALLAGGILSSNQSKTMIGATIIGVSIGLFFLSLADYLKDVIESQNSKTSDVQPTSPAG